MTNENLRNRSTAPTPEIIATQTAQMTEACKSVAEQFAEQQPRVELVLTDAQAATLNDVINNAILEGFERYFAKL